LALSSSSEPTVVRNNSLGVTAKLGLPLLELALGEVSGFALRDNLLGGVGDHFTWLAGYELMLGYRGAGYGLLVGAFGGWASWSRGRNEPGDSGLRYRGRVRAELPCPWSRLPFLIDLHWDPAKDGSAVIQGAIPCYGPLSLYGGFRLVHHWLSPEQLATDRHVVVGLSIDAWDHYHLRAD
jgi:hypothetical protein